MKLPLNDNKFLYLIVSTVIVLTLEILSNFGIDIPFPYSIIIYSIFILTAGWEVLENGIKSLFKLNFGNISLLMLIVVIAAYYLGDYVEAAAVIVLYALGEKLEDTGIEKSLSATERLISDAPKTALIKNTGNSVPVDTVEIGTVVQIKPYEQIPLDGTVEKGETSIDESSITGEPLPAFKTVGDSVFAGTWNKSGFIEICTTKEHKDSTFSRIISLAETPQKNQADVQKFIERFAKIYTPIIIICAIMLIVIPVFIFHQDFQQCLHQSIMLLVISCPCALVISTPVAIYAALGNASSKGALIKGGKFLEILARIKAIGLDKTRTVTYGKPVVSDVIPMSGVSKEELLGCSAGTELFSEHPLAQAIVDASKKEGFIPHEAQAFESIVGEGAKSQCTICNGDTVLVGKTSFIEKYHHVGEEIKKIITQLSAEGKTSIIVSCGDKIKGIIGLSDEIKPDSAETVKELQNANIETVMITGDNQQSAQSVANKLNIKEVFGGLLPHNKVEKIKALEQKYKYVAMVGDGINDAPALAAATVGIAMGAAGSDTAIEIADIALMNDKLSLLPFLVRLAQKTVKTIRWNTFGAIAVKLIFILLTFLGYNSLVLAIIADVGVTLIVVLISLRLMNTK